MDIWPKDRGVYYGSFAFASVVLGCFAGYFTTRTFYGSEWMALLSFALGAVHVILGILCSDYAGDGRRRATAAYFLTQLALLTVLLVISPARGFMGIIVLPVVSQAILLWAGAPPPPPASTCSASTSRCGACPTGGARR